MDAIQSSIFTFMLCDLDHFIADTPHGYREFEGFT